MRDHCIKEYGPGYGVGIVVGALPEDVGLNVEDSAVDGHYLEPLYDGAEWRPLDRVTVPTIFEETREATR